MAGSAGRWTISGRSVDGLRVDKRTERRTGGQVQRGGSWMDEVGSDQERPGAPPYANLDSCDQMRVQRSNGSMSLSAEEEHSLPETSGEWCWLIGQDSTAIFGSAAVGDQHAE